MLPPPPRPTLFPYTTLFRSMVDLNGDNLPDKVFKKDGAISVRLNTSGPSGATSFAGPQQVPTLPGITEESSSTFSFGDRKSTRLNSSHLGISYAVFCLKKKI